MLATIRQTEGAGGVIRKTTPQKFEKFWRLPKVTGAGGGEALKKKVYPSLVRMVEG